MTTTAHPRKVQNHRDLIVWQKAVKLAVEVHRLADCIRQSERYLLRDQMLRAAMSVPANIAEGNGRLSKGDYVRFIAIARGSLQELDTFVEIACETRCITPEENTSARVLVDEISRMLWALAKSLGTRTLTPGA